MSNETSKHFQQLKRIRDLKFEDIAPPVALSLCVLCGLSILLWIFAERFNITNSFHRLCNTIRRYPYNRSGLILITLTSNSVIYHDTNGNNVVRRI